MPAVSTSRCRVLVCTNQRFGTSADSCGRRGAADVLAALDAAVADGRLPADIAVTPGPCFGHCTKGPNVRVVGGNLLHGVAAADREWAVARVANAIAAKCGGGKFSSSD
ncbi:hypothetical protein [Caenispirillum salinarum]|uniref:hypothetical protein n=1 Tax=Caenispirillum salinarum TaxID=859058 RepID=UPI00384D9D5C